LESGFAGEFMRRRVAFQGIERASRLCQQRLVEAVQRPERFTEPSAHLRRHRVDSFEDVVSAGGNGLGLHQILTTDAVGCSERDQIFLAKTRDHSAQHRLRSDSLANFPGQWRR